MVTKNLAFKIQADDADALKSFGRIARSAETELRKAGKALDETETAGKRLARELERAAEQIDTDLAGIRSASDKLSTALGSDFDAGGAKVEDFVADLRRAGLTFDEIEADADQLAAAIRKIDDVRLKNVPADLDSIDDAARRVGDTTDKSRSVMANFAGNAVQELPGIAAAMGPVNTAMGQFAEYAAEGDINLMSLAKAAGPMIAVSVTLATINHLMGQYSKANEANREQVDELVDSLTNGASSIEAVTAALEEARQVSVPTYRLFGGGAKDLTADLAKVGLTADQTAQLIEGGRPDILAWADAMRAAGADVSDVNDAVQVLAVKASQLSSAEAEAARNTAFFGATTEQVAALAAEYQQRVDGVFLANQQVAMSALAAEPPVVDLGVAFGSTAIAAGNAERAAADLDAKLIALNETVLAQASSDLALRNALDQVEDSMTAYTKALKTKDVEQIDDATRDLEGTVLTLAEAAGRAAVDGLGPMASEAEKAAAKNSAMRDALVAAAKDVAPGSQAYQDINAWIAQLGRIPNTVTTRIGTTGRRVTSGGQDVIGRPDDVQQFATGGVVQGPPGSPQLAIVHAGETVLPTHRYASPGAVSGGAPTVLVQVSGSVITERDLGAYLQRILREELLVAGDLRFDSPAVRS